MDSVMFFRRRVQRRLSLVPLAAAFVLVGMAVAPAIAAPPPVSVPGAGAATEAEMKPYTDVITNTDQTFDMLPIPGGTFLMGSPDSEIGRKAGEGPQHQAKIDPFWMGKLEVTWDEYEEFMLELDVHRRTVYNVAPTEREKLADAVTRPSKPYTDMTFDMGKEGYPAISMTQHAAKTYCRWLSVKTGRTYRLPTEAEWEYACRAGTTTAYHFGDDPKDLGAYAWYVENSENDAGDVGYGKVGQKKPNAWALHDMHGNVAEWVLDAYDTDFYKRDAGQVAENPLNRPTRLYGRVVRGGSWDDAPELLRSAARRASRRDWKQQDPQLPQSIWYHTDAQFVGFRVVRPLREPTPAEKKRYDSDKFQSRN